jgi:hypothetical protein
MLRRGLYSHHERRRLKEAKVIYSYWRWRVIYCKVVRRGNIMLLAFMPPQCCCLFVCVCVCMFVCVCVGCVCVRGCTNKTPQCCCNLGEELLKRVSKYPEMGFAAYSAALKNNYSVGSQTPSYSAFSSGLWQCNWRSWGCLVKEEGETVRVFWWVDNTAWRRKDTQLKDQKGTTSRTMNHYIPSHCSFCYTSRFPCRSLRRWCWGGRASCRFALLRSKHLVGRCIPCLSCTYHQ